MAKKMVETLEENVKEAKEEKTTEKKTPAKKAAAKKTTKKDEIKEEVKEEEKGIDIEPKEEITFEEFGKMQFQVGEIISCEAVKNPKNCSVLRLRSAAR